MKSLTIFLAISLIISVNFTLLSQDEQKDKGQFIEKKNEFWEKIEKSANEYQKPKKEPKEVFKMDFSGLELPTSVEQFERLWHNPPISQGWTGTCWAFSTTSYLESEIYRLHKKESKLSEMFTVYWEYVEKAKRFVKERGSSAFAEGSEANAVTRMWKMYGIVPLKNYPGKPDDQEFHDHRKVFKEMNDYLENVKSTNVWNEEEVTATIKSILNHYIGTPPEFVEVDGKKMTPKEYLREVVQLDPDNYVDFMSLLEKPYYQQIEYAVPDNWWHSEEYYNVPLDEFMNLLKTAVRNGHTTVIGGDVSEPGYDSHCEVALVPSFDIPSEYIDENARQLRFINKSTTDDHGIHVVGYLEKDGKDWYLIKDSGSGSRNGENKGYYFYNEDYIKLKMMNIMLPKDAAPEVIEKFGE
jgi:bleomycin hydrolase